MLKKSLLLFFILLIIILSSNSTSTTGLFGKPKVRINDIKIQNEPEFIQTNKIFMVQVSLINERVFFKFQGELHAYLTSVGFPDIEIGKENITKFKDSCTINIPCFIKDTDINNYVEIYKITVILYEKRFGFLFKKDSSSLETIRIISKFWEKDKVRIVEFKPVEKWPAVPIIKEQETKEYVQSPLSKAEGEHDIPVKIKNDGKLDVSGIIRIYLIDKPSILPFVEGFNEIRKEIGITEFDLKSNGEDTKIVRCHIREADAYKEQFDVQAILFVNIDGMEYEVYESSIQSIKVDDSVLETIVFFGFWSWIVSIALLFIILLFVLIIRIVWPAYQIKRRELKKHYNNIKKKEIK